MAKNTLDIGDKKIVAGFNFATPDPFFISDPKPGFRYYAAINSDDANRPGSIPWCRRHGYEVDSDHDFSSMGHTSMRIPIELYQARKTQELLQANALAQIAASPDSLNIPSGDIFVSEKHSLKVEDVK